MLHEIQRRDAVIDELLRRVEVLERQVRNGAGKARPTATAASPVPTERPSADTSLKVSPPRQPPVSTEIPSAVSAASDQGPEDTSTSRPRNRSGGKVDERDAAIARALESTLIDQGGALLPPWSMQLVPDFGYTYQSLNQLSFVGPNAIVTQRSSRSILDFGLSFRIGLPWDTQFTFRLPFTWAQGNATFAGAIDRTSSRGGLGDISFGLQKQVLRESGPIPDLLVNLNYRAATGGTSLTETPLSTFPFAVGTGSGFNSLVVGATVLKRQDPLVFLGSLSYIHTFPATINGADQQLGEAFEFRFSPILAASPDTSLRIAWDTTIQGNGTYRGRTINGSNQVISFLELGLGTVLTSQLFRMPRFRWD